MAITGGIDTDVKNRMMQLRNNPEALANEANRTGNILDLIAARRAADLVNEQKRLAALEMNGSPPTVKDQVEQELIAQQKQAMAPDLMALQKNAQDLGEQELMGLRERTQGVSGVLANQNRQRLAQQRQVRNAAMGGIINAPAPNLNRMYNGGIVGYSNGGFTQDEITAYLRRVGVSKEELDNASPEARARVIAAINEEIAEDRKKGTRRSSPGVGLSGGSRSPAASEDVTRQATENIASLLRGDPRGKDLLEDPVKFNPTERQDEAERLMNLPDVSERDFSQQTMMPVGKMVRGMELPSGTDPQTGLTFAETERALLDNPNMTEQNLMVMGDQKRAAAEAAKAEAAKAEAAKAEAAAAGQTRAEVLDVLDPNKLQSGNNITPITTTPTTESDKQPTPTTTESGDQPTGLVAQYEKIEELRKNKQENQNGEGGDKEPVRDAAEIRRDINRLLDRGEGIKGIMSMLSRVESTPTYGDNTSALAQFGRDISKTRAADEAQKLDLLQDELTAQLDIEKTAEAEKAAESRFSRTLAENMRQANQTNVRLKAKDYNVNQRQIEQQAATNAKNFADAKISFEKLGLQQEQLDQLSEHQARTIELQEAALVYKQDAVNADLHRVVQGYIASSNKLYTGLIGNANPTDIPMIIRQQQAEQARLARMIGADGLNLETIQNPPTDPTDNSGFSGFEKEE